MMAIASPRLAQQPLDPALMEPCAASQPFTDAGWAFELPLGGHRVLARFGGGACSLRSRHGADITAWFGEVSEALAALDVEDMLVDGELCVLDAVGRNDPVRLHERAVLPGVCHGANAATLCLHDLLVCEGRDVRPLRWIERRRLLRQLPLSGRRQRLQVSRVMPVEGEWLYGQALALGRPALHARRMSAPYVGGRSADWLVIRCTDSGVDRLS